MTKKRTFVVSKLFPPCTSQAVGLTIRSDLGILMMDLSLKEAKKLRDDLSKKISLYEEMSNDN